ncbi:MAG: hypothetical protein RIC03_12415 [Cyclobacteriaceae bacterium]
MDINRGQILKDVIEKYRHNTGTGISAIARKAGYHPTMPYRHFKQPDLPTHIIRKYGRAMNYDFTDQIPEMAQDFVITESPFQEKKITSLEECLAEKEKWKEKYFQLLEKTNQMLQDRIEQNK